MSGAAPSEAVGRVLDAISLRIRDAVGAAAFAAVTVAIESATGSIDSAELARRCNRSTRSLSRDLQLSGLPPPGALIAWGKLLVAVSLLEDKAVSAERAALEVGLSGSAALVHLCRRHIGPTPGELRQRGGVLFTIGLLQDRIDTNRSQR